MATIFPGSASVGQVFDGYTFDGTAWNINGIDLTENYLEESSASSTYLTQVSASTTYAPIVPAVQTGFRNAIINGDFGINQRGFTSLTTNGAYGFDRWLTHASSGGTYSAQTFTPGAAPVSGYEGKNFYRIVTTGQSGADVYTSFEQRIEDVRTFAGQTTTVSFWAKATSGTPKAGVSGLQQFGTGGSPSSDVIITGSTVTLSTSWARYSVTLNVPSISGKTVGTTDNTSILRLDLWTSVGTTISGAGYPAVGIQNATIQFWGVQWEAGSIATPFQTATGTIQGELAACQRYYYRTTADSAYTIFGNGSAVSTTQANAIIPLPVTLRTSASSVESASLALFDGVTVVAVTSTVLQYTGRNSGNVNLSVASGLTQYRPYFAISNNTTSGYIAFNAEL